MAVEAYMEKECLAIRVAAAVGCCPRGLHCEAIYRYVNLFAAAEIT